MALRRPLAATIDSVSVEVELAPAAGVTREMRRLVTDACNRSGLHARHVPLQGDRSLAEGAGRVAEPQLSIILRDQADLPGVAAIKLVQVELTEALVAIRKASPSLPLGFRTVTPTRTRWYGFRPAETPAGIREAMGRIDTCAGIESGAVGWSSDDMAWVDLDVFVSVEYPSAD